MIEIMIKPVEKTGQATIYTAVPGSVSLGAWQSVGAEQLRVLLPRSWTGTVEAYFAPKHRETPISAAVTDGICEVPYEATAEEEGGQVSFRCTMTAEGGTTVLYSTTVDYTVYGHAEYAPDPRYTPTLAEQLTAQAQELVDKADADAAAAAASAGEAKAAEETVLGAAPVEIQKIETAAEAKKREVLDSIPADYQELAGRVLHLGTEPKLEWEIGKSINDTGAYGGNSFGACCAAIPLTEGDALEYTGTLGIYPDKPAKATAHFYAADGTWLGYFNIGHAATVAPEGTASVRFAFRRNSADGITMTAAELSQSWKVKIFTAAASAAEARAAEMDFVKAMGSALPDYNPGLTVGIGINQGAEVEDEHSASSDYIDCRPGQVFAYNGAQDGLQVQAHFFTGKAANKYLKSVAGADPLAVPQGAYSVRYTVTAEQTMTAELAAGFSVYAHGLEQKTASKAELLQVVDDVDEKFLGTVTLKDVAESTEAAPADLNDARFMAPGVWRFTTTGIRFASNRPAALDRECLLITLPYRAKQVSPHGAVQIIMESRGTALTDMANVYIRFAVTAGWSAWTTIETEMTKKPWAGKKLMCIGDSIVAGKYASSGNGWVDHMAELCGFKTVVNRGIAGSCYQRGLQQSGGVDTAIVDRIRNLDDETDYADLFLLWAGTNDVVKNGQLGAFGELDDNTLYGAFENGLAALLEKFPNSRVAVLTPAKYNVPDGVFKSFVSRNAYQNNRNGFSEVDAAEAIREVSRKYSVPVLDMFNCSSISPFIPLIQQTMYRNGDGLADGLHFTAEGYTKIAKIIGAFVNRLEVL